MFLVLRFHNTHSRAIVGHAIFTRQSLLAKQEGNPLTLSSQGLQSTALCVLPEVGALKKKDLHGLFPNVTIFN